METSNGKPEKKQKKTLNGLIAFVFRALITKQWEVKKTLDRKYWKKELKEITLDAKPLVTWTVLLKIVSGFLKGYWKNYLTRN